MPRVLGGGCERCNCAPVCCCAPMEITITLSGYWGTMFNGMRGATSAERSSAVWDTSVGLLGPGGQQCECPAGYPLFPSQFPIVSIGLQALCDRGVGGPNVFGDPPSGQGVWTLWPAWCRVQQDGTQWSQKEACGSLDCFPPRDENGSPDLNAITLYGITYEQMCQFFPKFCQHPGVVQGGGFNADNVCDVYSVSAWLSPIQPKWFADFPGAFGGYPEQDPLSRVSLRNEFDRNGVYVLARELINIKPDVTANVVRSSVPQGAQPKDASLFFEVERRRAVYFDGEFAGIAGYIGDNPNTAIDENWVFCVDHRCFRHPMLLVCTVPPGAVKPHLVVDSQGRDDPAELKVKVAPMEYMVDASPHPIAWEVSGVEIESRGSEYEVGDVLPIIFRADSLLGKTIIHQARATVTSVDEDGGITGLAVSGNEDAPRGKYARYLCHGDSVASGGSHYAVNDTIYFECAIEGACDVIETIGVGYVADVDETGAILDWEISGSDSWVSYWSPDNDACEQGPLSPDRRGRFAQQGHDLCDLRYYGAHVVRAATSQYQMTFCETGIYPLFVGVQQIPVFTNVQILCGNPYSEMWLPYEIPYSDGWLQIVFPPFPSCGDGGASAQAIIQEGANDSFIGGKIASVQVLNGGAGYAYIDVEHREPILPTALDSRGAEVEFEFEEVLGFPRPGLTYFFPQNYALPPRRYAWYYVTSVNVVSGGSGYSIGEYFEIQPTPGPSGQLIANSDNPAEVPNGTYYDGLRARIGEGTQYFPYFPPTEDDVEGYPFRYAFPILRVAAVDESGAITALVVEPGFEGMLYRPVAIGTKRNPAAFATASASVPGYGAVLDIEVELDANSEQFGAVTAVNVVPPPPNTPDDPLYPGNPMPVGGRDYVSDDTSNIWVLRTGPLRPDLGGAIVPPLIRVLEYRLLAGETFGLDPWNPDASWFVFVDGQRPPYVPWSTIAVTDAECPNKLLDQTHVMCEYWDNTWRIRPGPVQTPYDTYACSGGAPKQPPPRIRPECAWNTGVPTVNWAVLRGPYGFRNCEWGMTMDISHDPPSGECVTDQFRGGTT